MIVLLRVKKKKKKSNCDCQSDVFVIIFNNIHILFNYAYCGFDIYISLQLYDVMAIWVIK